MTQPNLAKIAKISLGRNFGRLKWQMLKMHRTKCHATLQFMSCQCCFLYTIEKILNKKASFGSPFSQQLEFIRLHRVSRHNYKLYPEKVSIFSHFSHAEEII